MAYDENTGIDEELPPDTSDSQDASSRRAREEAIPEDADTSTSARYQMPTDANPPPPRGRTQAPFGGPAGEDTGELLQRHAPEKDYSQVAPQQGQRLLQYLQAAHADDPDAAGAKEQAARSQAGYDERLNDPDLDKLNTLYVMSQSQDKAKGAGYLQYMQSQYQAGLGAANGALGHGEVDDSLRAFNNAMPNVPDGYKAYGVRMGNGIRFTVTNLSNPDDHKTYDLSLDQYHGLLRSVNTQWDHVYETGIGNTLEKAMGHPGLPYDYEAAKKVGSDMRAAAGQQGSPAAAAPQVAAGQVMPGTGLRAPYPGQYPLPERYVSSNTSKGLRISPLGAPGPGGERPVSGPPMSPYPSQQELSAREAGAQRGAYEAQRDEARAGRQATGIEAKKEMQKISEGGKWERVSAGNAQKDRHNQMIMATRMADIAGKQNNAALQQQAQTYRSMLANGQPIPDDLQRRMDDLFKRNGIDQGLIERGMTVMVPDPNTGEMRPMRVK